MNAFDDFLNGLRQQRGGNREHDVTPDHVDEEALKFAFSMMPDPECVPCAQMNEMETPATWVCFFDPHTSECNLPEALPMCNNCKRLAKSAYNLRYWPHFTPAPCEDCGTPIAFTHYVPISHYQ